MLMKNGFRILPMLCFSPPCALIFCSDPFLSFEKWLKLAWNWLTKLKDYILFSEKKERESYADDWAEFSSFFHYFMQSWIIERNKRKREMKENIKMRNFSLFFPSFVIKIQYGYHINYQQALHSLHNALKLYCWCLGWQARTSFCWRDIATNYYYTRKLLLIEGRKMRNLSISSQLFIPFNKKFLSFPKQQKYWTF